MNFLRASGREAGGKEPLKDRLMNALEVFEGPICIILSGGDPATAVFQDAAKPQLDRLREEGRLMVYTQPEANHVFSRGDWRAQLVEWSVDWVTAQCIREVPVGRE
jgi:hypothetical protein